MKKLFFLASIILLGLGNISFADICCPEKKQDPCFDDSDLFRKEACVVFVNGEFLYWRADAGALEYAFKYDEGAAQQAEFLGVTSYGVGEYKIADYSYDPGFRLAFGWFNAPDYWQLYAQFTWMRISGSDTENRSDNQTLVGAFAQNGIINQLQSASSSIKLNHELGDILVSRVFITNPHLRLRLLGGFTGGRIQQKWDVTYVDINDQKENIFNKWRFVGIGFRLGLDFEWFWGNDFYLSGKVSTAPLVGRHKNFGKISADTATIDFENIRYSKYRGAYNVDAYFGPSYQKSFDCARMEIFAGYELDGWFNVLEIIRPTGSNPILTTEQIARINNGMFLMHGLTARLTVDF